MSDHRTWTFRNKLTSGQPNVIHLLVLSEGNRTQIWVMSDGSVLFKPHDGKGPEHYRDSPMWEEV